MFKRYDILDKFDKYDRPLRGIATNTGYTYETMSGIKSTEDNGMSEIDRFWNNIKRYKSRDGDMDVSGEIRNRLEDLGYA